MIPEPSCEPTFDLQGAVKASPLQKLGEPTRDAWRRRSQVEFVGDRAALVSALCRGDEGAAAALFHEYVPLVERIVGRVLGVDAELPDVTQDVFVRALGSVHRLRDPQALTDWLMQIAICTATDCVRRRQRRRWLRFVDPAELETPEPTGVDHPAREALSVTYRILDRFPIEERTVFVLRFMEGYGLEQVALSCGCSLATAKRRLQRASARFQNLARREPALRPFASSPPSREKEVER